MLSFTVRGKGRGAHTKLRISNEIKSRVTSLIANSKSKIYFFSNIEIGTGFANPHLHVQVWHDDLEAVMAIRKKIIKEFGLVAKRCDVTLPKGEPQQQPKYYDYVIKDYAKNLSDDEVWNLEQTKKRMRNTLDLQVRFISQSKGKYTQKLYKMVYRLYGVLRALADKFIEFFVNTFFVKRSEREVILDGKKLLKSFFIPIKRIKGFDKVFYISFYFIFDIVRFAPSKSPPFSFIFYSIRYNNT